MLTGVEEFFIFGFMPLMIGIFTAPLPRTRPSARSAARSPSAYRRVHSGRRRGDRRTRRAAPRRNRLAGDRAARPFAGAAQTPRNSRSASIRR